MLIVAPPSETKRPPPDDGSPLDLGALSFPELTPVRERVIDALIETSSGADAFRRLGIRPSMADDLARNTMIHELPTIPAAELYTGPLHVGMGLAEAPEDTRERAATSVVITSAVWGVVRPDDLIPTYRCDLFSHLVGMDRPDREWRPVISRVLAEAAGDGIVVDLRSPSFQQIGRPTGLGDRTVVVRVEQRVPGRRIGDVVAKRVRGEAARFLLDQDADPAHPAELAEILGEVWSVALEPPDRRGGPWTLNLSVDD